MEQNILKSPATWFVGEGEGRDYTYHGASYVFESGGLVPSRNAALDYSWSHGDATCIMLDDDVNAIYRAIDKKQKEPISFVDAVHMLHQAMSETRNMFYFGGSAPTNNTFYFNPLKPISFKNFINASLMYIRPCELWFDPQFRLKDDYDYTLQHIQKYGGVCRRNDILLDVKHYGNKGGAVEYRTDDLEQQTIQQLKAKWGQHIRDNPRRKNEILLKV